MNNTRYATKAAIRAWWQMSTRQSCQTLMWPVHHERAAAALRVIRTTPPELVNERRGISPEMAVRISKVFDSTPESWLTQQAHYDLAQGDASHVNLKRLQVA